MKYMGSKRSMLLNGLGSLLLERVNRYDRFVDLFAGGGSVSWFVAEKVEKPVLSVDLQKYSTILCDAVITRTEPINPNNILIKWIGEAEKKRNSSRLWKKALNLSIQENDIESYVNQARTLCKIKSKIGPIWNAYGGFYFSPAQALTFDYLLNCLPVEEKERTVCLASCISAASQCVASPGHTAQPFRPTRNAGKYILESWRQDPLDRCKTNLEGFCSRYAKVAGYSITGDAQSVVSELTPGDLVFIDPPYSNVQYSRFYHVLEVIARGEQAVVVSGAGRYPAIEERPQSKFSNSSQAKDAIKMLLGGIAEKGSTIIFTFPSGTASNALSGSYIKSIASKWFTLENRFVVKGKFSSLGGNNGNRDARKKSSELILLLKPK